MSRSLTTTATDKPLPGQPTKYKPEYCQQVIEFIEKGGEEIYRPFVVSDGKEAGSHIEDHPVGKLPATFEAFARHIDVCVDTLDEWQNVHPEFSEAYQKAKKIQLDQISKGLLANSLNTAGAIFMLKNCHGWRDRFADEQPPTPKSETNILIVNIEGQREQLAGNLISLISRRGSESTDGS